MVWKTCRRLFSVEFVLAALITNMWPQRPGSVEETLPLPSMRNDWSHLSHLQPCWRPHCPKSGILGVPESQSPFPSDRTLHASADEVPLAQSSIGCSSRRRSPREWSFSQVQTESGGARVEHLEHSRLIQFPFLSGSPCALMSAQCCSLPRRTSSECSCILFLTISDPSASSLVANLTCVRLHVWIQFLTRTQIVSFLPGTCSPLSTQTASPHQPWGPIASPIDLHWLTRLYPPK